MGAVPSPCGTQRAASGFAEGAYTDHLRKLIALPALGICSSAARRYQQLVRYWDHYR